MPWRGILTALESPIVQRLNAYIADDLENGEMHGVLKMPNGGYRRAQYLGPGTQVLKRIARGDKGRTPVDIIAKQHDRDYSIAQTKEDVTRADERMIRSVDNVERRGLDSPFNIMQAKVINLKYAIEAIAGDNALGFAGTPGDEKHRNAAIMLKGGRGAVAPGPQFKKKPSKKKLTTLQILRDVKKKNRF